ncbi:hypothetical protein Pan216_57380 [Planctomycetes bacterium Pan216]|uniref:Uncharacterized protein n=1 Tax=Kolteria novifilia TaxID=2527975 RepID=A0A518BCY6_9BACT|nr:hypothetical protein Pan216_57380 [Planctomycetes bacterium Pan216]
MITIPFREVEGDALGELSEAPQAVSDARTKA